MDLIGLIRRGLGAVGVILVAFGLVTAEDAASATTNVEVLIGAALFLFDFGKSVVGKIKS